MAKEPIIEGARAESRGGHSGEDLRRRNVTLEQRAAEHTREIAHNSSRWAESERSFRLLVEGATGYAIFMPDTEGFISTSNTGAERIKGYSEAEITGKHFSLFYTDEDRLGLVGAGHAFLPRGCKGPTTTSQRWLSRRE